MQGARPLFFLDYFAVGKLHADVAAAVVSGIARGCRNNGCALIGGETAEMPGLYADSEYDLAGFIVGAAERSELLTGKTVRAGDVLLALPSTGLHTNGYSLARKLLFDVAGYGPDTAASGSGRHRGEALLAVHRSYLKPIRALMARQTAARRRSHHRRRHHRQHAAHAAQGARRDHRYQLVAECRRFSKCCGALATFPTTITGALSIWASG